MDDLTYQILWIASLQWADPDHYTTRAVPGLSEAVRLLNDTSSHDVLTHLGVLTESTPHGSYARRVLYLCTVLVRFPDMSPESRVLCEECLARWSL